jgi:DNA-binding transcriptional LysR family regulator
MDIRHLRYFVAVAEEGSMTRAAERLGIAQPPLGQQIRLLEERLGVQLFDRLPRQIVLNESGRFFLEEARAVLRRAEEARVQVRRFSAGESGLLNVGMTSSASLHPLAPKLLRSFHDAYALAEVSVRESETYELVVGLQDGTIDAALFHISTDRFPDLAHRVLTQVELMVAVPNGHPLTRVDAPVTLEALQAEPLVVYRRRDGPGIFEQVFAAFAALDVAPNIAGEVTRLIAAINLVAAGRGISLVPATMRTLHPESVTYLQLAPGAFPTLPLALAYRRDQRIALVQNFVASALGDGE